MGRLSPGAVRYLVCAVLFAAVVRTYLPATEHGYVFDDHQYIVENVRIHTGLTAPGVRWAFTTTHASNWHPLAWISHMLDVTLYGPKPAGHRLTSVLIHSLSTVLLFLALVRMTGSLWRSAFVAALFGLHPLRVESVAWIAERKDVLCAFFWVLTMICYAAYSLRPNLVRYALVVLAFAAALMSKPMAVTLPVVLLMLDFWPLDRVKLGYRRLLVEKLPLLAMSAVSAALTVHAQHSTGAVVGAASLPVSLRLPNAILSYLVYIRKMFWPSDLAVYYTHPLHSIPVWQVIASATALIAVTYIAVKLARKAPYLTLGWLWYLVTLLPVIGLVQVGKQAMADRYTYIPLIGLFVAVGWGLAEAVKTGRAAVRALLPAAAVVVVGLCAFQTSVQLAHWRDEVTLFSHALRVTQDNWMAHHGLARALDQRGQTDKAIEHYRLSIDIDPTNADVHNGLGTALLKKDLVEAAIREFETAVRLDPENAAARLQYGVALDRNNNLPGAARELLRAVELASDNPLAHKNLAGVLARQGKYSEAVKHYLIACDLTGGSDLDALTNLAEAYYQSGRPQEAVDTAGRALQIARQTGNADAVDYITQRLRTYAQAPDPVR